jgi:hypothetical protein
LIIKSSLIFIFSLNFATTKTRSIGRIDDEKLYLSKVLPNHSSNLVYISYETDNATEIETNAFDWLKDRNSKFGGLTSLIQSSYSLSTSYTKQYQSSF